MAVTFSVVVTVVVVIVALAPFPPLLLSGEDVELEPAMPPVTPTDDRIDSADFKLVQVIVVPVVVSSGIAKQFRVARHGGDVVCHFPLLQRAMVE